MMTYSAEELDYISKINKEITNLSEDDLASYIRKGNKREELVQYFGVEEYESLRSLVPVEGKSSYFSASKFYVILLPGIMGSTLGDMFRDVWLEPLSLMTTQSIRVLEPGHVYPPLKVRGLIKKGYQELNWFLQKKGHSVMPFGYDWRQSIENSAKELKQYVEETANDIKTYNKNVKEVKFVFVAHSMGGLVARLYLQKYGTEYLNKLIMLGTPNKGSYNAIRALKGTFRNSLDLGDKVLGLKKLIAKLISNVDEPTLQQVLHSFQGLYQLCPDPKICGQELYQEEYWPERSIRREYLDAIGQFHADMEASLSDKVTERMFLIANNALSTCTSFQWRDGTADFPEDSAGDGTVPFDLAYLPSVKTYLTDASHGSMLTDNRVQQGINDLILQGRTQNLTKYHSL